MTDAFTPTVTRRALVTGASRGIGAAVARALAADGHRVVMNYLGNHVAAEQVAGEIRAQGGQVELCAFDVGDPVQSKEALTRLDATHDPFTIIINNAGVAADGPFAGMKHEHWERVLRTSLDGFFNVTQPLTLPMVRQRWGRIVNLVSFSGVSGNHGQVNYGAAKAGLIGATKSLAKELASRNITVNALCPGLIDTDMLASIDKEAYLKRVPLGRIGQPDDIANAIRYLVSEQASYVTGMVLQVGGGFAG
jgi:3-oxoacyl-[acyl-carrier protein] reductase